MSQKIKDFVSSIDQFLQEFDVTHPPSRSQQAEFNKYQEIYRQRDIKKNSEEG